MTREESLRLQDLIDSLKARLRPVCADWPEDMFDEVVRELAEITIKYESTATPTLYDRRHTDRLVADLKDIVNRSRQHREAEDSPEASQEP